MISMTKSPPNPAQEALPSFFALIRKLLRILPRRRAYQAGSLVVLTIVTAVAEVAALGAVAPFLQLISNPALMARYAWVGNLSASFGIETDQGLVGLIAAVLIGVSLIAMLLRLLLVFVNQRFIATLARDVSVCYYKSVIDQPYQFHKDSNSSEIVAGIQNTSELSAKLIGPAIRCFSAIIIATCIIAAVVASNPGPMIITLSGIAVAYASVSYFIQGYLIRAGGALADLARLRIQTVQESIGNIRDIILDATQEQQTATFSTIETRYRRFQSNIMIADYSPRLVVETIVLVAIVVLAFQLFLSDGDGSTALPALGVLAVGAQRLLPLLQQIYSGFVQMTGVRSIVNRVTRVIELPMLEQNGETSASLPLGDALELRDVQFSYSNGVSVLKGVTLRVEPGDVVGIVGKTGSGKSTTIDIMLGLLIPSAGEIRIGGMAIGEEHRAAWRRQVSHVPQDIYLLDASVAENIALSTIDDLNMERVKEAARLSRIAEHIDDLVDGYRTFVGERGAKFSGGQRQRIGIARALYRGTDILFLDEATSSLDPATEASIMTEIIESKRFAMIVAITHRAGSLKFCNKIYSFEDGRAGFLDPNDTRILNYEN